MGRGHVQGETFHPGEASRALLRRADAAPARRPAATRRTKTRQEPGPYRPALRYRRSLLPALLVLATALLLGGLPAQANAQAQVPQRLRGNIAAALVVPDGGRMRHYRWNHEPEVIALYFGADWCGPCHAFVPTLVQVRDALRAAGADTEVVYVSLDGTEAQMRRYMQAQAMPWPAVDYRRIDRIPGLRGLSGLGPPNLVLLDRQGRILGNGWQGRRHVGLQPVMRQWLDNVCAHGSRCPTADAIAAPGPAAP